MEQVGDGSIPPEAVKLAVVAALSLASALALGGALSPERN